MNSRHRFQSFSRQLTRSLLFYFCLSITPVLAQTTVYFHNPEANINDFRTLTMLFDDYLKAHGNYRFQPVEESKAFEKLMAENQDTGGVFVLSSLHHMSWVMQNERMASFKPVLVGVIDGETTYTKIITTQKSIGELEDLRGQRIAAAGNPEPARKTLEAITGLKSGDADDEVDVLTVPKDIDALMSVLFGMAQGALTSRHSLEQLAKLNPKKYEKLSQRGESGAIMLPVVSAYSPVPEQSAQLIYALEQMGKSDKGREALGLLGLSGWQILAEQDLNKLKSSEIGE